MRGLGPGECGARRGEDRGSGCATSGAQGWDREVRGSERGCPGGVWGGASYGGNTSSGVTANFLWGTLLCEWFSLNPFHGFGVCGLWSPHFSGDGGGAASRLEEDRLMP